VKTVKANRALLVIVIVFCATIFPAGSEDIKGPSTEEYIIITNSILESTFWKLANWKAHYVSGTGVYTISWIESTYTGVDLQDKIRNFIKNKYINHGTQYVLLGGDTSVVPHRGFYVTANGYTEHDMPADMYYSHLDGTFDADGDTRYAEPGEVDWTPEVAVGRAPVETVKEADIFVNKVITYEKAHREKVCQFHQAGTDPETTRFIRRCERWVPSDYVIKELFEENGHISKKDWIDAWSGDFDGNPHYPPVTFLHVGNGNTTCITINYEVGGHVSWCNKDCSSLTNTNFFPVFFSVASHVGDFRANDCLAEELVKSDAGAIAAVTSAHLSWQYYCHSIVLFMHKALFDDGKEHLGDMLNQGKSYLAPWAPTNPTCRWCFYAFNLIGDPETPVLTQRGNASTSLNEVYAFQVGNPLSMEYTDTKQSIF
jgi:hypothetical protein